MVRPRTHFDGELVQRIQSRVFRSGVRQMNQIRFVVSHAFDSGATSAMQKMQVNAFCRQIFKVRSLAVNSLQYIEPTEAVPRFHRRLHWS